MSETDDVLSGKELGGALEELRRVARVYLPDMAGYYGTSAGHVASTHDGLEQVFQRAVGAGGSGVAYQSFSKVRDVLHAALADTANNLNTTGVSLGWAVDALASADEEAGEALDAIIENEVTGDDWTAETPPISEVDSTPWIGPADLPSQDMT